MVPLPPDDHTADDSSALLTVIEAAQLTGLSYATIYGWIAEGKLPAMLIEREHRLRAADVVATQATAHLGAVVPAWRADRQRAGTRLHLLREVAGLSQLQLAAATGISHEAISTLEAGKRAPLAATVRSLAQGLGIEPNRFVGDDQPRLTMLTVAETAAWLAVPVDRVRYWLKHATLPGTKVSGRWRVPTVAVVELNRSGRLRGHSRRLDPRYRG